MTPKEPNAVDTAELLAQYQRLLERVETNEREFRRLARAVSRVEEDERLRLHGGQLELHSAVGEGTRLRAIVPTAP
jgi:hypothetical protein